MNPHLATSARILTDWTRELEALGAALSADPGIAPRHMLALQAIDRIAQEQAELAILLAANFDQGALATMRLDDMKARFSPPDRPCVRRGQAQPAGISAS